MNQKAVCMYTRDRPECSRQCDRRKFFFLTAVEAARECAQRLTDINKSLLWGVKDFTSRIRGHPTQIGALTLTYYCDHWESFPLSDCTWYLWIGQSKSVARAKAGTGFAAGVDMCTEVGSRVLSLRHGLELHDVALYRPFPMPTGEVETLSSL